MSPGSDEGGFLAFLDRVGASGGSEMANCQPFITAKFTQNAHDSPTGSLLLIPQCTRLGAGYGVGY